MTIPLVFFSLTALVLWFIIGARGHWALKALIILLTLHISLSVGMSIPNFAGWPSDDPLPKKFLVHWIIIKEPDKITKNKVGEITGLLARMMEKLPSEAVRDLEMEDLLLKRINMKERSNT